MAKLYFRYGAMGAAKSLNLLAVAHNYRRQGKKPWLIKPALDTRTLTIQSRTGLRADACSVLDPDDRSLILGLHGWGIDCVLLDEAQFLSSGQVEDLRELVTTGGIPAICYGLLRDFQSRLFPGSQRLIELADDIEEIKTTCQFCPRKATQNLRLIGGERQIQIGGDLDYAPACWGCYAERAGEGDTNLMNVQLVCLTCGRQAKRALLDQSGCRGAYETASEPARCPAGHGEMVRKDGAVQEHLDCGWVVTGHRKPLR